MKIYNTLNSLVTALLLSAALVGGVSAGIIDDDYMGGDDHGWGDIVGSPGQFDVEFAHLTRNGTVVSIDIYTNFAGLADDGLFAGLTPSGNGIGYGDMFLSNTWTPNGSAPYLDDNHSNGTNWSYGLALDDRWSATGGTLSLYALTGSNAEDALLSEDFLDRGIFRNGQEIAVDTDSTSTIDLGVTGTWSVVTDGLFNGENYIHFEIDLGSTGLLADNRLAIHWGMLCGNDVIEGITAFDRTPQGDVPIPEPGSLALTLLGALGLRRMRPFNSHRN